MRIVAAALLLLLSAGVRAQMPHDPLTAIEVDQMRDSAPDPKRRIELLLGFAGDRLMAVERLRSATDPSSGDESKAEDLLGDFAQLIDELDDNLEAYSKRGDDLREPLRHVLGAEAGFQQKLTALADLADKAASQTHGNPMHGLAAALEDATDSLESSNENAKAILAAEIQKRGKEKSRQR